MKLTVFLGHDASDSFDIGLIDNNFTNKWLDELSWCLENCEFDHNECFVSFLSIKEKKDKLLRTISVINEFLKKLYKNKNFIELPDVINWDNQEFYNYLHLKFEELSGTFENPTKLFAISTENVKQAIRDLNFLIHELENDCKFYSGENSFKIAFNKNQYRRLPLSINDYEYFTHDLESNCLYLGYIELGKTLVEVFEENLPLDYKNLKNLHFYSGECLLKLGQPSFLSQEFKDFCITNNINLQDKTLGIGNIKLGYIENPDDVKNKLKNNQYLHSIKIERHKHG